VIVKVCQSAFFSKMAPSHSNSSSTRNGTTWLSFISSSSPFVKRVTCALFQAETGPKPWYYRVGHATLKLSIFSSSFSFALE
jgi:hypothetical protein